MKWYFCKLSIWEANISSSKILHPPAQPYRLSTFLHTTAHSRTLPHTPAHHRALPSSPHTPQHSHTLPHSPSHSLTLPHTPAHTLTHSLAFPHTPAHSHTLLSWNALYSLLFLSQTQRNPAILKCTLYCIPFYSYQKPREILLSWNAPYTVFPFYSYQKPREILLSWNAPYTAFPFTFIKNPEKSCYLEMHLIL